MNLCRITNINYKARVSNLNSARFKSFVEQNKIYSHRQVGGMISFKCPNNIRLIVFPSTGSCRLMGCKSPFNEVRDSYLLPFTVENICLQSISVSFKLHSGSLNLRKLAAYCHKNNIRYEYEPELFPALRLTCYNPICVNVFSTGKVIMMGIKQLYFNEEVHQVMKLINVARTADKTL